MRISELKKLVKQGESETLEFKASTGKLSHGMQTVCAFLNSDKGGTVIFGVKDDGKITGQAVTDNTRKDIATEMDRIEPYAHAEINVDYVRVADDRHAIVISVRPGEQAPYTYDARPFIRNQSTTVRMSREMYAYLHNKSNPESWEKSTNNKCGIGDLDKKRIHTVVQAAIDEKRLTKDAVKTPIPALLNKLGLAIDGKPTNAAVVLFCSDEDKQFMQCSVQMARFKGITKSEFITQKLITANAFDLYDKAMEFMIWALPVAAKIVPGRAARLETPAIPYEVLREALLNAIIHRDYFTQGSNIAIAVYDDRITITNPGPLPKGVNIRLLSREHRSIQRNPLIAKIFYLCGEIEKWGRGTLDMIKECKSVGNPVPKFQENTDGFSVTLRFKEPMITVKIVPPDFVLTDRQKKILSILEQGPLSRQQIMAKLRPRVNKRAMQAELAKLKKLGLIQSMGAGTTITWILAKS